MTLYKFLTAEGCGPYSKSKWSLPANGQPGDWMPKVEELVMCEAGYHACREKNLTDWIDTTCYEFEYRGELLEGDDKVVVQEARLVRKLNWDAKAARLFACDCAERVLPLFEKEYPNDARPRKSIKVARDHANGEATFAQLKAAKDAAWAASGAAWAASDAVSAAANAAAGGAAWAASDAARAAAKAAASDVRDWPNRLLVDYLEGRE